MDPSGVPSARFRLRRSVSTSSDKFLGVFNRSRLETAVSGGVGDELSEDDVFWTGDFAEHNHSSSVPSTTFLSAKHHPRHISQSEIFGILAALPATESDQTRSVFNHKASVSTPSSPSSASSSKMIPMISKKPPLDRQGHHQSAPVNVPVMTEAMRRSRAMRQFGILYDKDEEGDDGEMLPPHEVAASPMISSSVLEGVGRTLKGRDLRQVRNAVFRRTGFID